MPSGFDPSGFLDLADHLLVGLDDLVPDDWSECEAARIRSSISRAYYSAFLALKARLLGARNWGRDFPQESVHRKVRQAAEAILGAADPIVQQLKALHQRRRAADYDLDQTDSLPRAESHADLASDTCTRIAALTEQQVRDIAAELFDIERGTRKAR